MKTITRSQQLTLKNSIRGVFLDNRAYDLLIDEPMRVNKDAGSPLLILCKGAAQYTPDVIAALAKFKSPITNRGAAVGVNEQGGRKVMKKDGTRTKTVQIPYEIARSADSGILGYFDRGPRYPFARETVFSQQRPEQWRQFQPFVRSVAQVFAQYLPERYQIQQAIASLTPPDWIIKNTPFSSVTVNRNFRTAAHKDAGDLPEGFGVMAYLAKGELEGGYLVLPEYKLAARLEHGDIVLFDVHSWHGNTRLIQRSPDAERITCVFYYRNNLLRCGNAQYEINRAKRCRSIGALYDPEEIDRAIALKAQALESCLLSRNI